jgi:hypothetical protein
VNVISQRARRLLACGGATMLALSACALAATPSVAATSGSGHKARQAVQAASRSAARPDLPDQGNYNIYNANSNKVAEVYHSQTQNYANVDQYHYNGTLTEDWTLQPEMDNYYEIVNVNSGKCMEVYHSQTQNYANVDQYQCNGTNTQLWFFGQLQDGNYEITNRNTDLQGDNMCLDVYHSETQDYANIDIYSCNGTLAQQWYLVNA